MPVLQTVENAGRVIDLFTVAAPEWGVSEASAELGISKSGTHALLSTLADIGLLRRTPESRYRIGWRVLALSRTLTDTTDFLSGVRGVLEGLLQRTGETVHMATLQGGKAIYIDRLEGNHSVRIAVSHVGAALPAHCSGVGKVLLAYRQKPEVDAVIARHGLPKVTGNTITDPDRLHAELAEIRRRGYAWDDEEIVPDVSCVAAPIIGPEGFIAAAVSLSAPTYRFTQRREVYKDTVCAAAREISGTPMAGRLL
jgi:DNA-binding IclR family transcriptional regulator